jgi:hypothetical protein
MQEEALPHNHRSRICLTKEVHDFLDDIRWIVQDLQNRSTRFREIVPTDPSATRVFDAAAVGMGGVLFIPDSQGGLRPLLWRDPFLTHVTKVVVSSQNLTSTITSSDLELAGTFAEHDMLVQSTGCHERTIFTLTDNTPVLAWQTKGSTTTTTGGIPAYLLRLQALHQRHCQSLPS